MGKTARWGTVLVVGVALALASSSAEADYVLSVVDSATGMSEMTVDPGDSFALDVALTSDMQDWHESFKFDLTFAPDSPALQYDSYMLDPDGSPPVYVTGGVDDFSNPPGSYMAGTAEAGWQFLEGTLVELGMTVPAGWDGAANPQVLIDTVPDFFSQGFVNVPATAGGTFTLNITPEPATLALLALGGIAVLRRRRA